MRDPKYGHNSTVLVARLRAEKSKAEVQCAHCEAKGAEKSMMRCPFCGYLACMGCRSFIEAEKAKDYA